MSNKLHVKKTGRGIFIWLQFWICVSPNNSERRNKKKSNRMSGRRSSCYLTKWKCVRQINSLKMFICTVTNSYSMDLNRNRTVKNKSIKKYASKTASKWNWSNRVVKTTNHSEHGNKLDHSKWFFLVFAYVYPFFVIFGSVFSYLVTLFFLVSANFWWCIAFRYLNHRNQGVAT